MSLESLQIGAFDSAPVARGPIPTMIKEAEDEAHDYIDREMLDSLAGATEEVVMANRTIRAHRALLTQEIKREEAKQKDLAQLDRQELTRDFERQVELLRAQLEASIGEVTSREEAALEELSDTHNKGQEFLATCEVVGETIAEGVTLHRAKRAEIIATIDEASEYMTCTQAELEATELSIAQKVEKRRTYMSDYTATDRIIGDYRRQRIELEKESMLQNVTAQANFDDFSQRQPRSVEEINSAFSDADLDAFAFRKEHTTIINRIDAIENEIAVATTENMQRAASIDELNAIIQEQNVEREALIAFINQLSAQLRQLEAMKRELTITAKLLHDRGELLQKIARSGIEGLDNVPLEMQSIVRAALGASLSSDKQDMLVDYATTIPGFNRDVVHIDFTEVAKSMKLSDAAMLGYALRAETEPQVVDNDLPEDQPEAELPAVEAHLNAAIMDDKVRRHAESIRTLRQWVNEHMNGVPEAESFLHGGFVTSGLHAQVRVKSGE